MSTHKVPALSQRWPWVILPALFLVIGLFVFVLAQSSPDEPAYQGRTLRSWIGVIRDPKSNPTKQQTAKAAIKAMGTNAIPGLLHAFKRSDTTPLASVYRLVGQRPPDHIQWSDDWYIRNLDWVDPAIRRPVLDALFEAHLAQRNDQTIAERRKLELMAASSRFSDFSQQFIAEKLTNALPETRAAAVSLIGVVGNPSTNFIPVLGELVTDPNEQVRWGALNTLSRYRARGYSEATVSNAVEALRKGLSDPNPVFRQSSASFLSLYIERARPAVPDLIRLLDQDDSKVVRDAILIIDPEAAKKLDEGRRKTEGGRQANADYQIPNSK